MIPTFKRWIHSLLVITCISKTHTFTFHNHRKTQWSFIQLQHASKLSSNPIDEDQQQTVNDNLNKITKSDKLYMDMALEAAQIGFGQTYPNPAVGCILVSKQESDDEDIILGSGFHPKAGMPHAEVFALLQAAGHVNDGIEAAKAVLPQYTHAHAHPQKHSDKPSKNMSETESKRMQLEQRVTHLLEEYSSPKGAETLFQDCLHSNNVTAYVTLEPCCHFGRTPPCSMSLSLAGVNRVVVGYRDPNPRVDGGGVQFLRNEGIEVDYFKPALKTNYNKCANIVDSFIKRITTETIHYHDFMNGKKRRYLRSLANQQKQDKTMVELILRHTTQREDPRWLEDLDSKLWKHELVIVRMNRAFETKKECHDCGESLADEFNAHLVQVLGRTILLYRPGVPQVIDLDQIDLLDGE